MNHAATPPTVEDRVLQLVADVFGVPRSTVHRGTKRDDVASWDSVNVINLVMALEAEFAVAVGVEETAELVSVERILATLRENGVH